MCFDFKKGSNQEENLIHFGYSVLDSAVGSCLITVFCGLLDKAVRHTLSYWLSGELCTPGLAVLRVRVCMRFRYGQAVFIHDTAGSWGYTVLLAWLYLG